MKNTNNSSKETFKTTHQDRLSTQVDQDNAKNTLNNGLDLLATNSDKKMNSELFNEFLYEQTEEAKLYNRNYYGLLGILNVIRMTDDDLNILALGTDLTVLGLNLNSSESLYTNFYSPWNNNIDSHFNDQGNNYMDNLSTDGFTSSEQESRKPDGSNYDFDKYMQEFSNCNSYTQQIIGLKSSHIQKFSLDTLFYIFYNMPNDLLQGFSAVELCNRGWAYNSDSYIWYLKTFDEEISQSTTWYLFDVNNWYKTKCSEPENLLNIDDIRPSVEEGVRIHSKWIQEQNQVYQTIQQQLQQKQNHQPIHSSNNMSHSSPHMYQILQNQGAHVDNNPQSQSIHPQNIHMNMNQHINHQFHSQSSHIQMQNINQHHNQQFKTNKQNPKSTSKL